MWIVTLLESLIEPYGTIQIAGWFPSIRNAEDFIAENRKNMRKSETFNYAVCERYHVNYPTKIIERKFPHFTTTHEVYRWDNEKNTFVRDKRLDSKIPKDYWIAFRRQNGTDIEFRQEMLQR